MTVRSGLSLSFSSLPAPLAAGLLALCAALAGCSSNKPRQFDHYSAQSLYHDARKALEDNDYETSVKQYEALTSRYPFSDETRQARLDLIYVYYRKGEKESATDAADHFLRENPTHPRVDYAWYMKGLIDFEDQPWAIERWIGVDPPSVRPHRAHSIHRLQHRGRAISEEHLRLRLAARMIYLRNRLADYEVQSRATTCAAAPTSPPRSAPSA